MRRPLLLAHRGARLSAPENSFAAFDQALADGCDGFEFDLRRTAERRSFVCHDSRFAGLTIARANYSEIAARWKSHHAAPVVPFTRGEPRDNPGRPCLEDVLERYAASAFLDIEIKDAGLETAVNAAVRATPPQCGYVVSSFLPQVITAIHLLDPQLPLGLICDQHRQLQGCTALPVSHVMTRRHLLSRQVLDSLHAAGKQVFVWTVNDAREMLRLAEWGVDAIISDDTALLCRVIAGR